MCIAKSNALWQCSMAVRNIILLRVTVAIKILSNNFRLVFFFASNFLMKITLFRPGVMLSLHSFLKSCLITRTTKIV
jgi:hypothetical protein